VIIVIQVGFKLKRCLNTGLFWIMSWCRDCKPTPYRRYYPLQN